MGNCLVTKLKESINNPDLLKIGEIKVNLASSFETHTLYVGIPTGQSISVRVLSGNAYFDGDPTKKEVTVNAPTDNLAPVNITCVTDCNIAITRKLDLLDFFCGGGLGQYVSVDAKDVKLMIDSGAKNANFMFNITGDFNADWLPNSAIINSNFNRLTGANVYGDATRLLANITGTWRDVFNMTKLYADLSQYPNIAKSFVSGANVTMGWKTTRPSEYPILGMGSVNLGNDVDAMLINQANCPLDLTGDLALIYVNGNCSFSAEVNAAIAALKGKGVSVKINGDLQ